MRDRMSKNIREFSRKFSDLRLIRTPRQGYGTPTIKPLPDVVPAERKRPPPRTESSASGAVVSKFVNSPSEKRIDVIHANANSMTRVCVWSGVRIVRLDSNLRIIHL